MVVLEPSDALAKQFRDMRKGELVDDPRVIYKIQVVPKNVAPKAFQCNSINEALENLQEGKKRAARQRFEHVRSGGRMDARRTRSDAVSFSPCDF